MIWDDDAPASAVNVIHKYVGALRRLSEPALPIRGNGSYLQRRGNGYLFAAGPGALDLAVFRESVRAAGQAVARQRREAALDCYVEALGLWQGPTGEGLAYGPTAMPIFAGLDSEFLPTCATAAELAVALGRPERVLPPLRLAASMAPLHEPVQASLISTLGAAGQQAQALSLYQKVRDRLAEELGIEPGPALRAAHQRVLNDTPSPPVRMTDGQPSGQPPAPWQRTLAPATPPAAGLVGRAAELAVLRQAAGTALTGGRGLAIIDGEPGVGKTRLLEEIAAEAEAGGALVVWGRCMEGEGTPSMWPWVQATGTVLGALPATVRQDRLTAELDRLLDPGDEGVTARALPDAAGLSSGCSNRSWPPSARPPRCGRRCSSSTISNGPTSPRCSCSATWQRGCRPARWSSERCVTVRPCRVRSCRGCSPRSAGSRASAASIWARSALPRWPNSSAGRPAGRPAPDVLRDIHARTAGNPFFVRERVTQNRVPPTITPTASPVCRPL
ncbi:hypothetical protein GCM10009733_053430 [Nonomuraea maheshkhaliensis]|uniref:Bacterial transcriptional activator domain-containing protein n=1 Tax=Nonomuraea maheshkhaliensis TaxID=419590 RepID=A0ABN2FK76_9ACTN